MIPLVVSAYCCREWLVCPYYPIGRCGYCGERPEPRDND